MANQLSDGRYIAEPEIATELPPIWFPKTTRLSAETALRSAIGTIKISGTLREGTCDAADQQMFTLWIVEMPDERESDNLRNFIGDGVNRSGQFIVAFSVGRLFGLGVAGSYVEGTSSFESLESLAALVKPVEKQLIRMESR